MAKKIQELMEAPTSAQNLDWLKKSLQAALELELCLPICADCGQSMTEARRAIASTAW
jgi:hypothetical protein